MADAMLSEVPYGDIREVTFSANSPSGPITITGTPTVVITDKFGSVVLASAPLDRHDTAPAATVTGVKSINTGAFPGVGNYKLEAQFVVQNGNGDTETVHAIAWLPVT